MAVEIPRLSRSSPVAPEQSVPIRGQSIDVASTFAKVASSASNALGDSADQIAKYEHQAADDAADKMDIEFRVEAERILSDARSGQGDPTAEYAVAADKLDAYVDKATKNEELPQLTKNALARKLEASRGRLEIQRVSDFNVRQSKFQDDNYQAGLELDSRYLIDASSHADPNDEKSLALVEDAMDRLIRRTMVFGLKRGTVVADPNGPNKMIDENGEEIRVRVSKSAEYAIKKSLGDAIHKAIEAAADSGNLEKAQFLRDKYQDYMDPSQKNDITKKYNESLTTQEADELVRRVRNGEPRSILRDASIRVQDKASQTLDDLSRRDDNDKKRNSDANYNAALKIIETKRAEYEKEKKILVWSELEKNGEFKKLYDGVTDAKERKAIRDSFERPEESDPVVLGKLYVASAEGDFIGMDFGELQKMLSGASDADAKSFMHTWERDNKETDAEQRSAERTVERQVFKEAEGQLLVRRNTFTKQFSSRDQKYLNDLMFNVSKDLQGRPKMGVSEQREYIRNIIADQIKANAKKKGTFVPPPAYVAPAKDGVTLPKRLGFGQLTPEQQNKVFDAFEASHPGEETTPDKVKEFYEKDYSE